MKRTRRKDVDQEKRVSSSRNRRDTHGAAVPRIFKMARPSCVRLSSLTDLSVWGRNRIDGAKRWGEQNEENNKHTGFLTANIRFDDTSESNSSAIY